jgi:hypothetical protein
VSRGASDRERRRPLRGRCGTIENRAVLVCGGRGATGRRTPCSRGRGCAGLGADCGVDDVAATAAVGACLDRRLDVATCSRRSSGDVGSSAVGSRRVTDERLRRATRPPGWSRLRLLHASLRTPS